MSFRLSNRFRAGVPVCTSLNAALSWMFLSFALVATVSAQQTDQNSLDIVLQPGFPLEREISAGQKHSHQIVLTKGQFLRVEVKRQDVSLSVSLQLPEGNIISVVEPHGSDQELTIEQIAESSGIYRLNISTRMKNATGRYEIRITALRAATDNDRSLVEAGNLFSQYLHLTREGSHDEARRFLLRAREIRERVLGPNDLLVAITLDNLSSNYAAAGDYTNAVPLRERALEIKEKIRGPQHPDVAYELHSLGIIYQEKGDYVKAEELHRRALRIYEKLNRTDTVVVAYLLDYLADIYYDRGDYKTAEEYYERSRTINEKILGPDHFHLAASYEDIGHIAYDQGDYAKTETMFQRALVLYEKAFGPDHLVLTRTLNDLGMLYCTTGDFEKAETLFRRALSIHDKSGSSKPDEHEEVLFGLARCYAARGAVSEAVKLQARAQVIEEGYLELNLPLGSEREKLAFLDSLSLRSSRNISLHTQLAPDDPIALKLAITTILQRKGRVQDALASSLASLRGSFGEEGQKLLDQLNDTTSKLGKLILKGQQKQTPEEYRQQIRTLEELRETLESEISRRSKGFYERARPVTIAAVEGAIPEKAALIEFAVYRPFDPKAPDNQKAYGEPHYVAYILRRRQEVQWKELGEARAIDNAIDELRRALRNRKITGVKQAARAVDERVMRPLRESAGDVSQLLISPDGALNLIPFEALVDEQGRYLIERYSVSYLTSGRDLLRLQVPRDSVSSPLVIADPLFGEPTLTPIAESGERATKRRESSHKRRNVTIGSDLRDIYFAPLSVTAQEGRAIKSLFPQATLLSGNQATESSLKHAVAPSILHIATHGFFLADRRPPGDTRGTRAIDASLKVGNPLLRSGLALAGANLRKSNDEDGILTALEASGLKLWGTKLVTLSACDTGLGEVKNGEGVYGLRRAFVLAGTQTLVMSLWPVSDYMTGELMRAYYKGLGEGLGRGEALRRVQLSMLKRKDRKHPFYWASFIQSGEWANLDGKR